MIEVGSSLPQIAQDVTIDPGNITTGTVLVVTKAIAGITTNQTFSVSAPALNAGIFILGCFCATDGTLSIPLWNSTGGDLNPASQSFKIVAH